MLAGLLCRVRLFAGAPCMLLLLSSCSYHQPETGYSPPSAIESSQELVETPFFAQDDYQCGPASLAMVLAHQGVEVTPAQLQPLVYLPGNKGSLQTEMLAAPVHYGQLAVSLPTSMDSLLVEVSAGHPVVVLQNLGRSWLPVWHYAVVIGYDLEKKEIILRSGTERRHRMRFNAFLQTWEGAGHWAMVVVTPGSVPVSVSGQAYLKAASALERSGQYAAALTAFRAGSERWPDSYLAFAGIGNAAFYLSRFHEAETAYRNALALHPKAVSIMNNLALALAEQGCRKSALAAIECAIQHQPDDPNLAETREAIHARPAQTQHCPRFVCRTAQD